ncbi:MAG TPA: hypothetical protein VMU04_19230 [Candidatus Acidoferrum sp.]|nr:hypothetical protein [Candidatus Acidoferrum sp.]
MRFSLPTLKFGNIQHPTSNIQHPMAPARASIGCWVLDVGCWMFSVPGSGSRAAYSALWSILIRSRPCLHSPSAIGDWLSAIRLTAAPREGWFSRPSNP